MRGTQGSLLVDEYHAMIAVIHNRSQEGPERAGVTAASKASDTRDSEYCSGRAKSSETAHLVIILHQL